MARKRGPGLIWVVLLGVLLLLHHPSVRHILLVVMHGERHERLSVCLPVRPFVILTDSLSVGGNLFLLEWWRVGAVLIMNLWSLTC